MSTGSAPVSGQLPPDEDTMASFSQPPPSSRASAGSGEGEECEEATEGSDDDEDAMLEQPGTSASVPRCPEPPPTESTSGTTISAASMSPRSRMTEARARDRTGRRGEAIATAIMQHSRELHDASAAMRREQHGGMVTELSRTNAVFQQLVDTYREDVERNIEGQQDVVEEMQSTNRFMAAILENMQSRPSGGGTTLSSSVSPSTT